MLVTAVKLIALSDTVNVLFGKGSVRPNAIAKTAKMVRMTISNNITIIQPVKVVLPKGENHPIHDCMIKTYIYIIYSNFLHYYGAGALSAPCNSS